MPIPESQLKTWSSQGSITQSSGTYATIRNALQSSNTKYAGKSFDVYLQGSYGNDTNIFAESDVDVVIQLNSIFYYDLDYLRAEERDSCQKSIDPASYSYSQFYRDVLEQLIAHFGLATVFPGSKAIKIKANGSRRNADVLVATDFRRYRSFSKMAGGRYDHGLCFFKNRGAGGRTDNFPRQHLSNCTAKHQATNGRFKPMVRIFKNLRGRLVADGLLAEGVAPSYFLEGLLYNVPDPLFGANYQDTFIQAFNWIIEADRSKFECANGEFYLLGNTPVTWPAANCDTFLSAARELWNNWA